jgi:cob(I)alamin adenosyltransferase
MKIVKFTRTLKDEFVPKDSDVIWGVGSVDEANAFIGLAKVIAKGETKEILGRIQKKMFEVGTEFISGNEKISKEDVDDLLNIIKEVEKSVTKPRSFIILEQDELTAHLSVARAVVRRAERWAVKLNNQGKVGIYAVEWLNRLSCLLYLLILKELQGVYEVVGEASEDGVEKEVKEETP